MWWAVGVCSSLLPLLLLHPCSQLSDGSERGQWNRKALGWLALLYVGFILSQPGKVSLQKDTPNPYCWGPLPWPSWPWGTCACRSWPLTPSTSAQDPESPFRSLLWRPSWHSRSTYEDPMTGPLYAALGWPLEKCVNHFSQQILREQVTQIFHYWLSLLHH